MVRLPLRSQRRCSCLEGSASRSVRTVTGFLWGWLPSQVCCTEIKFCTPGNEKSAFLFFFAYLAVWSRKVVGGHFLVVQLLRLQAPSQCGRGGGVGGGWVWSLSDQGDLVQPNIEKKKSCEPLAGFLLIFFFPVTVHLLFLVMLLRILTNLILTITWWETITFPPL